jgi:hypothetical protein
VSSTPYASAAQADGAIADHVWLSRRAVATTLRGSAPKEKTSAATVTKGKLFINRATAMV